MEHHRRHESLFCHKTHFRILFLLLGHAHFSTFLTLFHTLTRHRSSPAPDIPLLVGGDSLHALVPVRGSGDRHRHPTHRGSGHHPAASSSCASSSSPGSTACRSRHLDAEIREDPDHGPRPSPMRSRRLVQQPSPPSSSQQSPITGSAGTSGDVFSNRRQKQSFLLF